MATVSEEALTVSPGNVGLIPSRDGREATSAEGGGTTEARELSLVKTSEFRREFLPTLRLYKIFPMYSSSNFWLHF